MGALYHLKQKLVDFCNVIQENVSRTDTVPSSKVVYDLKADSDSQISDLNDSLANKQNSIRQISVNLGGLAVTNADAGWYYAEYSLNSVVPSNAKLLSVQTAGSYDANVLYTLNITTNAISVRSHTSKTLGNNRQAVVYYYV